MLPVREYLELLGEFFASGGYVLWAIFLVSLLLWALIIERYAYLRLKYPGEIKVNEIRETRAVEFAR